MLSELEHLSQNISRLIAISSRRVQMQQDLERQLAEVRGERDAARAALAPLATERDQLREERDALAAKIDDAQVRLNAILEKLPHSKADDQQLDLLAPGAGAPDAHHTAVPSTQGNDA
jgi:uncharacterized coiled-coil DUF342 family protein